MIRLSPKDSSILARVAQYGQLPKKEREALVKRSSSAEARKAGKIILGANPAQFPEEIQAVAKVYREWAKRNRQVGNRVSQRRRAARSA